MQQPWTLFATNMNDGSVRWNGKKNSWGEGFNGGTIWVCNKHVNKAGTDQVGAQAPRVQIVFYLFIVIIDFIFVVRLYFSLISLTSLSQITTIQPKNLTKTIKHSQWWLYFSKKKLFYHQRTKKSCVIGEVKTNLFLQL